MNKNNKKWLQIIILVAVALIGGLTIFGNMSKEQGVPKVGDKAPDFRLLGMDGSMHSLSDYRGRPVLLNFWGSFCKPCRDEMPAIQRQSDRWSGQVQVLGINIGETRVTVRNFLDQVKVSFTVLLDDQEEVRRHYGISEYPTTVFIGADGKIRQVKVGAMDEPFIEQSLNSLMKEAK